MKDAEAREVPRLGTPIVTSKVTSVWLQEKEIPASVFVAERSLDMPPPDCEAGFVRLEFPDPVVGPLAFGFGAHFGLGLLVPDEH